MKNKKIMAVLLSFVMLVALSSGAFAATVYNKADLMPTADVATVDFSAYTQNEDYVIIESAVNKVSQFNGDWYYVDRWSGNEFGAGGGEQLERAKIQDSTLVMCGPLNNDLSALMPRERVIAYMSDSLANLNDNYTVSFDFTRENSTSGLMFRFNINKNDRSSFYALYFTRPKNESSRAIWELYQMTNGSKTKLMESDRVGSGFVSTTDFNYLKDAKATITIRNNSITVNVYGQTVASEGNESFVVNDTKSVTPAAPLSAAASNTYAGFCTANSSDSVYCTISSLKFENLAEMNTTVTAASDTFSYSETQYASSTSTNADVTANSYVAVDTDNNWFTRYGSVNNTNNCLARISEDGMLEMGKGPGGNVDGNFNKAWTLYRPDTPEVTSTYSGWGLTGWADEDWTLTFDGVLTSKLSRIGVVLGYDDTSDDYTMVQISGQYGSSPSLKLYRHEGSLCDEVASDDTVMVNAATVNIKTVISKTGNTLSAAVYNAGTGALISSVSYTEEGLFANNHATFGFTQLATAGSNLNGRTAKIDNVSFVKYVEFVKDGASDFNEPFSYADTAYPTPTAGTYQSIDAAGNWYTDYQTLNGSGNVKARILGGALLMTGGPSRSIDTGFNRGWTLYRPDIDEVLDDFGEWGVTGWNGDYKLSFDATINKTTTRVSAVFDYTSGDGDYYMVQINGGYNSTPCFALYKHNMNGTIDTLDIDDYSMEFGNSTANVKMRVEITKKDNLIQAVLYTNGDEFTTLSYVEENAPEHEVATLGFTENSVAGSTQEQFDERQASIDNVSFVGYDENGDSTLTVLYGHKNIGSGDVFVGEYNEGVLERVFVGDGSSESIEFEGFNPFKTYKVFFWNEFKPLQKPDSIN